MVGGGIFAVLGLAVMFAGGGTPIAFAFAGVIALVTSYSYARLSLTYPCEAGTVRFLNQAFGPGFFTGSANVLLWLGYIVTLSLYAYAFGSYGSSFFPAAAQPFWKHVFLNGMVVGMTVLNLVGVRAVARAEIWIVGLKSAILLLFIGIGFWTVKAGSLAPATWAGTGQLIAGGMVIFVAYEGFQLIANTATDIKDPEKNLPRSYYTAVGFVIFLYIAISVVAVGNLSLSKIAAAEDYALAAAAEPVLGNVGFALVVIAALASTSSALNATLYGVTRLSYNLAVDGELPEALERKVWNRPVAGLLISAGLTLVIANGFNLTDISVMGSSGFLIIFGTVNAANLKLRKKTKSRSWIPTLGVILCAGAFVTLIYEITRIAPKTIIVLALLIVLAVAIEFIYRYFKGREIKLPELKSAVKR